MSYALWLVPVGLVMGLVGLLAFLWSMKSGQLEDLDGAAARVLLADADDRPLPADDMHAGIATESVQDTGKGDADRDKHR